MSTLYACVAFVGTCTAVFLIGRTTTNLLEALVNLALERLFPRD